MENGLSVWLLKVSANCYQNRREEGRQGGRSGRESGGVSGGTRELLNFQNTTFKKERKHLRMESGKWAWSLVGGGVVFFLVFEELLLGNWKKN